MAREFVSYCSKCCECLITLVLTLSYYFTVILLSRNRPTFYLDDFYVPSLNTTFNSTTAAADTIYFDLRIKNENSAVGLYYNDPLNLTFTYIPPSNTTNTTVTIAEYAVQGFYQGNGRVKHVRDLVAVHDFFPAADHGRQLIRETYVSLMGPAKVVVFRVDLSAKVKFKSIENKKSDLAAGAVVEVNGNTGSVVQKKTIELEYASGTNKWGAAQWLMFFPLITLLATVGYMVVVKLPVYFIISSLSS